MVLPPSFAPKERKKREQERRSAEQLLRDEQQQRFAKERAKAIARKALEEKAEKKRLTSDDFDKSREQAQQLASGIYAKMKEAEKAKEAAQRLAPSSKRSKQREVSLKPSKSRSKKNPAESVAEAIGKRLRESKEARQKPREESKPREPQKSAHKPQETPKPNTPSKKERKERLGPKVDMRPPEVRGEEILSKQRLRELTDGEYSALKKKKDFTKRMKEAEAHLDLLQRYKGKERLKYGDIAKIAKELDVDPQTISNWLTKGMTPRLYTYMEWSTPKSEAMEKVHKLKEENGGVRGPDDVKRRLGNYYLEPEERASKFAKREEQKMLKYYQFLDRLSEGGNFLDIAKEVGLSESGAKAYLDGATPRWVGLAGQIPSETPRSGYKWLPLKYDHGERNWSDWIPVPEKITNHKQVMDVVKQLKPLNNDDMKRREKLFGRDYSQAESFMHMLGVYVSDSRVSSSSTSSHAFALNLSKKYDWSYNLGEATCYNLGKIGIHAHRTADKKPFVSRMKTPAGVKEIKGNAQYEWQSENTPLLRWIRRTCLGYDRTPKTYQKTDADWILKSPENFRKALLQGWSDGDGGVSTRGYYFSLSTHSDHDFAEKLLKSFGVETSRSKTFVRTAGFESLKQSGMIPPFKYATDRQEALEKSVRMIESRRKSWKSNPPSNDEIDFMKDLRHKGISYGGIGEKLYDEYGYTLDPRDISRIIRKKKNGEG